MTELEIYEATDDERRNYIEGKIASALSRIQDACNQFPPLMLLSLMSGGDDSLPVSYISSLHPKFSGILHVNTETGLKETTDHVKSICNSRGWNLFERKPSEYIDAKGKSEPISYRDLVLKYGFPGAFGHGMMYNRLKERQLLCFEREIGAKPKSGKYVIYVSGVRQKESKRRMLTTRPDNIITRQGRRVWVAAISDWTRLDCKLAREYAKLPRNPVSIKLGMSGECLCGAFAETGELERLEKFYPEKAAEIKALEKEAEAAGFPWKWEQSPPDWFQEMKAGQYQLFDDNIPAQFQHLCVSCNKLGKTIQD